MPVLSVVRIARVALGLTVLAVLFWYAETGAFFRELRGIDVPYVLAAMAFIGISTLLGAFNVFLLVRVDQSITFRHFLGPYWLAWGVGLVVPGQVGDVASLSVAMHRRGLSWRTVLGRSVLDKFISFAVITGCALATLANLPSVTPAIGAAIVAMLVVMAIGAWALLRRFVTISTGVVARVMMTARGIVREVWDTGRRHPDLVAINFTATAIKVLLVGAAYWSVFRSLGNREVELHEVVPLAAASSLVAYVPVSFNGLGTVEAAGLALFGAIGVSAAQVLAAYLVLRVLVLVLAWIPSGAWLLFSGKDATRQTFG